MADPFLSEIRMFGGNFAPVGWHICDGSLLSISQYDALYTLIGTAYGGDGITTFGLPNLQGTVPIHPGQGPGLQQSYALGQTGGSEQVTLLQTQIPSHNHMVMASTGVGTNPTGTPNPNVGLVAVDPALKLYVDTSIGHVTGSKNFSTNAVSSTGGSAPHDNMMPYVALNYIICLEGIYPSQG